MNATAVTDRDKQIFKEVKEPCIQLSQISFLPLPVLKTSQENLTTCLRNLFDVFDKSITSRLGLGQGQGAGHDRIIMNYKLADYIFVPISTLLKQDIELSDRQIEYLLKIITLLIRNCWYFPQNSSKEIFDQLFPLVVYLESESERTSIKLSDESKLAGMECMYSILESVDEHEFFATKTNMGKLSLLAKFISIVLDNLTEDEQKNNNVQLSKSCLNCLQIVYIRHLNDGEKLSNILPGNVSKLSKLISLKPHYTIITQAIDILQIIVTKVFDDKELGTVDTKRSNQFTDLESLQQLALTEVEKNNDHSQNSIIVPTPEQNPALGPGPGPGPHRTTSWLHATAHQVKLALPLIINVAQAHKRHEVKKGLFKFCQSLITHCSLSLSNCLDLILDCISVLSLSQDHELTNEIEDSMKSYSELRNDDNDDENNHHHHHDRLKLVLSKKLDFKISNISAVLGSSNQDRIVTELQSLQFYISQSSSGSSSSGISDIKIETFLDRMVRSLHSYIAGEMTKKSYKNKKHIQQVSFSSQDTLNADFALVQKHSLDLATTSSSSSDPMDSSKDLLLFNRFYDQEVELAMTQLFATLGKHESWINTGTRFLLQKFANDNMSKSLSLHIINCMIKGYVLRISSTTSKQNTVDEFIQIDDDQEEQGHSTIFTQQTVYEVLESADELITELSSQQDQLDPTIAMQQSIAMDSIAAVCTVLQDQFQAELIDYLYPVIDNLASFNHQIRTHAQRASLVIAGQLYNGSINAMIYENCDYLVDALSLSMTSDTITPRTSAVLLVLIKVGGIEIVRQLNDVVQTMFTLIDLYHGYDTLTEGFFVVFDSIIEQILIGYPSCTQQVNTKNLGNVENRKKPWAMNSIEEVVDLVDSKKRVLDLALESSKGDNNIPLVKHPNRPFGEEIPDSDDEEEEEEEDGMELMKEIDDYQISKQKEELQKWDSPIPQDLYFIVQRILSYGDRLILSTESVRLQARILQVFNKVVPILATSHLNVFPILADIWPLVVRLCVDDDIRVSASAINVAYTMIDNGGDFMSRKFCELWISIKTESAVFKEYSKLMKNSATTTGTDKSQMLSKIEHFKDNVYFKTYDSIIHMLVQGLFKLGTTIPNTVAREIINVSCVLIQDIERYGFYRDIAWLEIYNLNNALLQTTNVEMETPADVELTNGELFQFYSF